MPFNKNNPTKEKERLQELINESKEAKQAYEEFEDYYAFRKSLIQATKGEKDIK